MKPRDWKLIGTWDDDSLGIISGEVIDPATEIHVIEMSAYQALEARHKKLLEALKFIVSKENIMFAECTDAEEILLKCKQAIEADAKASGE